MVGLKNQFNDPCSICKFLNISFFSKFLLFLNLIFLLSCGVGSSSSTAGGAATASATNLSSVLGDITPAAGAPTSSVANAKIIVESHPELNTQTDENGHFSIENAPADTYNVYALSVSLGAFGNANAMQTADYGIKIPNIVVKSGTPTTLSPQALKATGSISGNIQFYQNPNQVELTGSDVYIPGTDFIGKTAANGQFALNGIPEGNYDLRIEHLGFQSFTLKNVTVSSGQTVSVGTLSLDLSRGPQGGISLDSQSSYYLSTGTSGAAYPIFKNRTVPLKIKYNADAVWMKVSDESAFLNKQLEVVSTDKNWVFTTDGLKSIYIQFYDLNALPSSTYYIQFYVDTESPTLTTVKLFNGWELISNHLQTPVDLTTTDSGSGIKEVMLSNTCLNFNNSQCTSISGSWQTLTSGLVWDLTSGNGVKSVYVKVRDFTGQESLIVSDSINKSTYSKIYASQYTDTIQLKLQQSPYVIYDDTVFNNLTLDAGVELTVLNNKKLTVLGKWTAVGTSGQHITLSTESGGCDSYTAILDTIQGTPGISSQNNWDYVDFVGDWTLNLNGGSINHSVFSSTCTATSHRGSIIKSRTDFLKIYNSTFDHWMKIQVTEGDGNTEITNNTGSFSTFFTQSGSATNSIVSGNTNIAVTQYFYEISSGEFSPTGNTLSGVCNGAYYIPSLTTTGGSVTINDPTPPLCSVIFTGMPNGMTLNINNTTVSGCNTFSSFQSSNTTTVNFNNVNVNCDTISLQNGGFVVQFLNSQLTASSQIVKCDFMGSSCSTTFNRTTGTSQLKCQHSTAGNYCDFFYRVAPGGSSTMTDTFSILNSTVYCGNNSCRGFSFVEPSNADQTSQTKTINFNLTLQGNTWVAPSADTLRKPNLSTLWDVSGVTSNETSTPNTYTPSSYWLYNFRTPGSNKYITINPSVTYGDGP